MALPSWQGRAVRDRHRHAIEQASRRWRGGRRDDSARTRRKILISTQVLAKQPDITEDQKSRIMAKVSHTMHKIQDDDSLVRLFSLPEQTVPAAETVKKPKKGKRKK